MSEPTDFDLLDLAAPYALDAVSDQERAAVDRQLAVAPTDVAVAFRREVRALRETMAVLSASTARQPPEHLRQRVLAIASPRRPRRWGTALMAGAAAAAIAVGAGGVGFALRGAPTRNVEARVLAAPDVHTVSARISSGRATVIYSREKNAGVLVMNDVPKPTQGTVYQMWLINDGETTSAGTMDAAAVSPSTTALLSDLQHSSALAFTVEPGTGSAVPTTPIIARLSLS